MQISPMQTLAPQRFRMQMLFSDIATQYPAWAEVQQEYRDTMIRRIERGCFEVCIKQCWRDGVPRLFTEKRFVERYSSICSRVLAAMGTYSSNAVGCAPDIQINFLLDGLVSGSIDPYNVPLMTADELSPAANEAVRAAIAVRQCQKASTKFSSAYTCRKCGGKKTTKIEFQSRAADEASAHSIKCAACEFVWRI